MFKVLFKVHVKLHLILKNWVFILSIIAKRGYGKLLKT